MLAHIKLLNAEGLFTSSEILCTYYLSGNVHPSSESLLMMADALYGKEEYPKALGYYKKCLSNFSTRIGGPKNQITPFEIEVRYKTALCLIKVRDDRNALSTLESIPPAQRSLGVIFQLAKLYQAKGLNGSAIPLYQQCLKMNPFALEAALAIIDLGGGNIIDASLLNSAHPTPPHIFSTLGTLSNMNPANDQVYEKRLEPYDWVSLIPEIHSCHNSYTPQKALPILNNLEKKFPENTHVVESLAKCYFQLKQFEKAVATFHKVLEIDPLHVSGMDFYGALLKMAGNLTELNKLGHALVKSNSNRPETWGVAALYCDLKAEKEKSFEHIDTAVRLGERHAMAHMIRGDIYLCNGRPEQAVASYRRAHSIVPILPTYKGIARSLAVSGNIKDAMHTAQDAVKAFPNNSGATALLGMVMSQQASLREKAKKMLQQSLAQDPKCQDTVLALSQLFILEEKSQDAINILKNHTHLVPPNDIVLTFLADSLVTARQYGEALEQYNRALTINPNNENTKRGLYRVELLMKGEDPDADQSSSPVETDEVDDA
eukprot:TRINITY_DN3171_c0_g1_i2.p1 TRINITY_DN3171_c0_g1~~TRINITY_DN3171_c0_g1_i2.p1  ORF type:complete len:562 (-),score=112.33 TRINITY_DN3171_c0_g1_i2:214-1848(-)